MITVRLSEWEEMGLDEKKVVIRNIFQSNPLESLDDCFSLVEEAKKFGLRLLMEDVVCGIVIETGDLMYSTMVKFFYNDDKNPISVFDSPNRNKAVTFALIEAFIKLENNNI